MKTCQNISTLIFVVSNFCGHWFHYYYFDLLWLVLINCNEMTWLLILLLNCAGIMQVTLSSGNFCLSLSEVHLFCPLWKKTLLLTPNLFCSSKNAYIFIATNFNAFYAFWSHTVFLLLLFYELFEPWKCFTLKMDSDVCDGFIGPS